MMSKRRPRRPASVPRARGTRSAATRFVATRMQARSTDHRRSGRPQKTGPREAGWKTSAPARDGERTTTKDRTWQTTPQRRAPKHATRNAGRRRRRRQAQRSAPGLVQERKLGFDSMTWDFRSLWFVVEPCRRRHDRYPPAAAPTLRAPCAARPDAATSDATDAAETLAAAFAAGAARNATDSVRPFATGLIVVRYGADRNVGNGCITVA